MADENSPLNPSLPKKETVRITLPPRISEAPSVKRETVRIAQNTPNDKGQTIRIAPSAGGAQPAPKKETTKMVSAPVPPPPKPGGILPTPPKPPSGGIPVPPRPPGKPAIPVPPAPPAAPAAAAVPAAAAPKPAVPKKETARIQIPPPAAKAQQMPKATVKLQQTQPLAQAPAPVVKTSTATLAKTGPIPENVADPMLTAASVVVFIGSIAAFAMSLIAYNAC